MTVNETLQSSQDTADFKKSFKNAMVYTNGVEAAQSGYNEMTLANSEYAKMLGIAPAQPMMKKDSQER